MNTSRAEAPKVPSKYSAGNPSGRSIQTIAAPESNPIGTSAKQIDSTRSRCCLNKEGCWREAPNTGNSADLIA